MGKYEKIQFIRKIFLISIFIWFAMNAASVPIKLGAAHILPMPANLQRLPPSAYLGGLAKCVPIEKVCWMLFCGFWLTWTDFKKLSPYIPTQRLNYGKAEYAVENADRFNEFLTTHAKQLLDEASQIYFKPLQKMDDNHIFGDIRIKKHTGHKVDLLRELAKRDGVRIDEHDIPFGKPFRTWIGMQIKVDYELEIIFFPLSFLRCHLHWMNEGIENWETTKTPRFKTDHGQLNVHQVPFMPAINPKQDKHHRSAMSVCSNDMDDDDKVVLNWSRQNTTLARDMERAMRMEFEAKINELDRYVMATRERRGPYQMRYNAMSLPSINQSQSNLGSQYGSRSTITDAQSIASEVAPSVVSRTSSRFTQRLKQAESKKPSTTMSKTTGSCASKVVLVPSGYERDILEFHKYNEFWSVFFYFDQNIHTLNSKV